jgi:MFS family permease
VSLIYLLGLVAMLAPAGRLGDAAGHKLVYTYGFAVFTVASLACGLARGIGTTLGISLMALALHLGSGAGAPHRYAGSIQAQPAFVVLAAVSAAAAAIALASRVWMRERAARPREADPSGVFS